MDDAIAMTILYCKQRRGEKNFGCRSWLSIRELPIKTGVFITFTSFRLGVLSPGVTTRKPFVSPFDGPPRLYSILGTGDIQDKRLVTILMRLIINAFIGSTTTEHELLLFLLNMIWDSLGPFFFVPPFERQLLIGFGIHRYLSLDSR